MKHVRSAPVVLISVLILAMGLMAGCADGSSSAVEPGEDVITVRFGERLAERRPRSGRVLLFLITAEGGRRWEVRDPLEGPFYSEPQPIASIPVEDFGPDGAVEFRDGAASMVMFGGPFDALDGRVRMQAVFDSDATERSALDGPGNVISAVVTYTADADGADVQELVLDRVVNPSELPEEHVSLRWIDLPSPLLSAFYGRPIRHRAGVALPPGYADPAQADRRWPTVYVIPGFGGRHEGATEYAEMFLMPNIDQLAPMAVTVVLDPESPLGHHGFVDSENNGPRGTALVTELIPHLEERFRIDASPDARIVTGHSSGGWTSLWLTLRWPEVFGACWSSAPDPIDFSVFQMTNLYEDESAWVMPDGAPTPSFREFVPGNRMVVRMTAEEEFRMEHAMDPSGGSGEQWDAWEAMFSPRDATTGMPRPICDPTTGVIDREVVESWARFDIVRLVASDWNRYGPLLAERVRLDCGSHDSFYLNRGVERLADLVRQRGGSAESIRLIPNEDHGSVTSRIFMDWNEEMRAWLEVRGYPQRKRR